MIVHRLKLDVNAFQGFCVEDENVWKGDLLTFDGQKKTGRWIPPKVYVLKPKASLGNFFSIAPGAFALDQRAQNELLDLLEMSGELLPLEYRGKQFGVMNVLECIDVLDTQRTKWEYGKSTGKPIRILEFSFIGSRFTEAPLFKIPETSKSEIYTVTGVKDSEDEFKSRVEACKLTGIDFEEIWSG